MQSVLSEYLPIVILAALALVFAVASLGASSALRPNRPNPVKLSPYECGNDPVRLPRGERFPVKFYVVAMLFFVAYAYVWRKGGLDWSSAAVTPIEPVAEVEAEVPKEVVGAR